MTPAARTPIPLRTLAASALLAVAGVAAGAQQPQPAAAPAGRAAAEAGAALGPAVIIDESLTPRSVRLVSIVANQLTFLDERNRRRQAPLDSVLAVLPQWSDAPGAAPIEPSLDDDAGPSAAAPARPPERSGGMLTLVDGQRFPGDLARSGAKADHIAWTHEVVGTLAVPLDRVAWFLRPGPELPAWSPPERAGVSDALLLANGDRLAGFIAAIGDPVRIEADAGVTDLPVERVRAAEFANPRIPGKGVRLWLSDGTVASVSRVELGPDRRFSLQIAESGATGSYEWATVRAVVTDAGRLRALSALDPVSQGPTGTRRFAPPMERLTSSDGGASEAGAAHAAAALDADDLYFPGPMTVSWELPAGARRLAALATLAPGAAPWGDCEVSVAVDGAEVWRKRLSSEQSSLPLSLDLPGRRLTITIDAGRLGPVRDRVILVRPLVLLGPSR